MCIILQFAQPTKQPRRFRRLARRETGLSLPVNSFTDRSKAVLLLWIIYVISVLFLYAFVGALWSPAGKGLTSWLSFVMSNCEVVTFPLVSWVRCGAWLYQFLMLPSFLLYFYHLVFVHTKFPSRKSDP